MPAVSESQQRLFGMVHAYQKGKLKHAPGKVKSIARHIDPESARHFAETKHDGLPERKGKDKDKKSEKKAAAAQPVTITIGRGKSYTFPSIKSAILYLQSLPGITPAEAREALGERAPGIESIKLTYPPASAERE